MKKVILIASLLICLNLIISCSSPSPCPDKVPFGNLGKKVNTEKDEYNPKMFFDTLFFLKSDRIKKTDAELFYSLLKNKNFSIAQKSQDKKLKSYTLTSTPENFVPVNANGKVALISGIKSKKESNSDLFEIDYSSNKSSKSNQFKNINSTGFESSPALSPNGDFIIFAADYTDSYGETDLYCSKREQDGTWSKPFNLGPRINTKEKEISPFISVEGNLYYSSNGFNIEGNFDIIKATGTFPSEIDNVKALKFPLNTEFDETGYFIFGEKGYLASNRTDGCGCFDIYSFDVCGPVILNGIIQSGSKAIKLNGKLELFNANEELIEKKDITTKNNKYEFRLKPKENYILKYSDKCYTKLIYTKVIDSPCSDTSAVKITNNIKLLNKNQIFDFSEYNVPFFVSGYYLPNTTENLTELRLKFKMNLLGFSDTTKYIEEPDEKYDGYAQVVDKALDNCFKGLVEKMSLLENNCEINQSINVTVTGFADPRPLSDKAKYNGDIIKDKEVDLYVKQGDNLDNLLLSKLRAYFIYKYLARKIEIYKETYLLKTNVTWNVIGLGSDDSALTDDRKRRVKLEIDLLDD